MCLTNRELFILDKTFFFFLVCLTDSKVLDKDEWTFCHSDFYFFGLKTFSISVTNRKKHLAATCHIFFSCPRRLSTLVFQVKFPFVYGHVELTLPVGTCVSLVTGLAKGSSVAKAFTR